jgi:hypothetical protein|tara:strand:+ start:139 stop:360 length:222 start_codon:yes stop_codon:yes gene_type:complete
MNLKFKKLNNQKDKIKNRKMQGIDVSQNWKIFGESLRVTNDFVPHCEIDSEEAPLFGKSTLLKTKQIDIYQNH